MLVWRIAVKTFPNAESEYTCYEVFRIVISSCFLFTVVLIAFFTLVFIILCFIMGNIWVFMNYGIVEFTNTTDVMYCDKLTYQFSFWVIIFLYTAGFILGVVGCALYCYDSSPYNSSPYDSPQVLENSSASFPHQEH